MKFRLNKFLAVLLAVGLLIQISACNQRSTIVVGTGAIEPATEISTLIAQELNSEFDVTLRQFASLDELTEAIERAEVDLGIIEEPTSPNNKINVLSALYPSALHVLVKPSIFDGATDKLDIVNLVKGRSVFAGPLGSAGRSLVEMLVEQRVFPPLSEFTLLESVFGEDADILVVFGGILAENDLRRLGEYRLFSLGAIDDFGRGSWAEGVSLRSPNIQPFIIPQGLYPELARQATVSLAVRSLLVTHTRLSDETAYAIMQEVSTLMSQIRSIYPLAGQQISGFGNEVSLNLNTHPGAIRYQQRESPGFFERYAELIALLITGFVGLSSLLIAFLRNRNQARKDRIDIYFDELLKIRGAVGNSTETNRKLFNQVLELQSKVTRLVGDERISADSSFVAFITLSNQVLNECRPSKEQL